MATRKITAIGRKWVRVSRAHWDEMWRRLHMSHGVTAESHGNDFADKIGRASVRLAVDRWNEMWEQLHGIPVTQSHGGNGCSGFCGAACADDGGCSLPFGSAPECGGECANGEVYLQDPV